MNFKFLTEDHRGILDWKQFALNPKPRSHRSFLLGSHPPSSVTPGPAATAEAPDFEVSNRRLPPTFSFLHTHMYVHVYEQDERPFI